MNDDNFTPDPAIQIPENVSVAASAVLVEKHRNEIATNWVKRP